MIYVIAIGGLVLYLITVVVLVWFIKKLIKELQKVVDIATKREPPRNKIGFR